MYLRACPPFLRVRTALFLHCLLWKLHQFTGLDLISTERTACHFLSTDTHTQGAQGKDRSINDWQLNYWLHTNETSPFKFNCQMKMKLQTPAACWGQHTYLLSADNLGDAGPAVNVGAVCNNRKPERVQAHRALLIRAAGQHQPQLLYQMLPQLCRCRCSTYRQNIW